MKTENPMRVIEHAKSLCSLHCVTFELLTMCNWKCAHCLIPEHDQQGLAFDEIVDIFKQLREMGCFKIVFTGGELFVRKDAMKIIETARSMYFEVVLFTNISLLDEETIKRLAELYLSKISCTVFSMKDEVHDAITGVKGSLRSVIDNAILIRKNNIPLEIKTILMNSDPFAYREVFPFCEKHGIGYLVTTNIFAKTNCDHSPKLLGLSNEQLETAIPEGDKIMRLPRNPVAQSNPICNSIQYSCSIDCHGAVYPCNNMLIEVGSLKKSTLKEIWYDSKKLRQIKEIKESELKFCSKCEQRIDCDRCAGIIYLEEGDLLGKSETDCVIAAIRYKNRMSQKENTMDVC